jgi:hypothetical protein
MPLSASRPRLAVLALAVVLAGSAVPPALAQATVSPAPGQSEAPPPRPGDVETGRDLVKGCQARLTTDTSTGDRKLSGGRCKDYLVGFFTRQKENLAPKPEERFCTNGLVTFGKIAEILVDHGRDRPDLLDKPPDDLIMSAMRTSFPCAKQDPQ